MPPRIVNLLTREKRAFAHLSSGSKALLLSFVGYHLAAPLIITFMNTFLWSQGKDLTTVCLYNGSFFASILAGFYGNALLIRKTRPDIIFRFSSILLLIPPLVIFSLPALGARGIIGVGFVNGLTVGIYWGNRNLMSLVTAKSRERSSFISLESAQSTLLGVLSPLFCGWTIYLSERFLGLDNSYSHSITMGFAIVVLVLLAARTPSIPRIDPEYTTLRPTERGTPWRRTCHLIFLQGFSDIPLSTLSVVLAFQYTNNEGWIGSLQAFSSVCLTAAFYYIGRGANRRSPVQLLCVSAAIQALGLVGASFSRYDVLFLCTTASILFSWRAINVTGFDAADANRGNNGSAYAHVLDRELYLEGGRLVSFAFILNLLAVWPQQSVIFPIIAVLSLSRLLLPLACHRTEKVLHEDSRRRHQRPASSADPHRPTVHRGDLSRHEEDTTGRYVH